MSNVTTKKVERIAYEIWQVMQNESAKRGMKLTKDPDLGDGRVIIGTIGAFINGMNTEREWNLEEDEKSLVRHFLKSTGNVVVREKLSDYQNRIFIREVWSDTLLNPDREKKRTKREEEPVQAPSEVATKYVCKQPGCNASFATETGRNGHMASHSNKKSAVVEGKEATVSERIAWRQLQLIEGLAKAGGRIEDENGKVGRAVLRLSELDDIHVYSEAARRAEINGLVTREVRGKRTYAIELTDEGHEYLEKMGRSVVETPQESTQDAEPSTAELSLWPTQELLTEISHRVATLEREPDDSVTVKRIREVIDRVSQDELSLLAALAEIDKLVRE